jgi:hypothetical protein
MTALLARHRFAIFLSLAVAVAAGCGEAASDAPSEAAPDASDSGDAGAARDASDDVLLDARADAAGDAEAEGGGDAAPDPCANGLEDGDETDVDCGGTRCGKCGAGNACSVPADCLSGRCTTTCVPPTIAQGSGTAQSPYLIYTPDDLDAVRAAPAKAYRVMAPLSLSGRSFAPIPTFSGSFDGNGQAIDGLTIRRPAADNVGLFGNATGTIDGVVLTNAHVEGGTTVGLLVGTSRGALTHTSTGGVVSGLLFVGGVAGQAYGVVTDVHSSATVTGRSNSVGGLLGLSGATVSHASASGAVTGQGSVGGLVGSVGYSSSIANSTASGRVDGAAQVGGLVGSLNGGWVIASAATGSVGRAQASQAGGLVGSANGDVVQCYATGDVTGSASVGGLVGTSANLIGESYSVGRVTGTTNVGGLVGTVTAGPSQAVLHSFWDTTTSGQAASAGGTGVPTSAMKDPNNWLAWDGYVAWSLGAQYPTHRALAAPCTVGAAGFASGSGSLGSPFVVGTAAHLANVRCNLGAAFQLAGDLDLAATPMIPPLGVPGAPFTGSFDGNQKTITGLVSYGDTAGLFGATSGATIADLTLASVVVVAPSFGGPLVGSATSTSVTNARVTSGAVRGYDGSSGGLFGTVTGGTLSRVGSAATVTVAGGSPGGLAGVISGNATVADASATGAVTGLYVGGAFAASVASPASVTRAFGLGAVAKGDGFAAGTGSVTSSFFDTDTTGQAASTLGSARSDAAMKTQANYVGWDFAAVWQMGGSGYPALR